MNWIPLKPRKYKLTTEVKGTSKLVCEIKVTATTQPTFWEKLFDLSTETSQITATAFAPSKDKSAISMATQKLTLEVEVQMQAQGHHR